MKEVMVIEDKIMLSLVFFIAVIFAYLLIQNYFYNKNCEKIDVCFYDADRREDIIYIGCPSIDDPKDHMIINSYCKAVYSNPLNSSYQANTVVT